MKKIIFTVLLLSSLISEKIKANPIVPPPVTSELYFNGNAWTLELVFTYLPFASDSLVIITSTDTVSFKPGFHITFYAPILITKDSLLHPLSINKNGDFVYIAQRMGYGSFYNLDDVYSQMTFGNIANAQVTAPLPGQSIKRVDIGWYCTNSHNYFIVKDSHPTLGSDPFNAVGNSSLAGYVYDPSHTPVAKDSIYGNGVLVNCPPFYNPIVTNSSGYFFFKNNGTDNGCTYSYIRHLSIRNQFCKTIDTTFSIEPDSSYIMQFTFDSCNMVGVNNFSRSNNYSLQIFPNPGFENFTFIIDAPKMNHSSYLIKIYNTSGELVNIIPIENVKDTHLSIPWNGKGKYSNLPSGIYTCSLEINGHPSFSQKLVIEK